VALPSGGNYAYGLHVLDDFFGEKLIGHSGSLIVATSYIGFSPRSNIGVAVMSNGNGYAMSAIAKAALATMLGKTPRDLAFVRNEDLTKELAGCYQTFRGTVKIKLTREGDCLRMEYLCGDQPPGPVPLIPESLGDPSEPRFVTHVDGARLGVQFHRRAGEPAEMIYERYKFRRTGPIA